MICYVSNKICNIREIVRNNQISVSIVKLNRMMMWLAKVWSLTQIDSFVRCVYEGNSKHNIHTGCLLHGPMSFQVPPLTPALTFIHLRHNMWAKLLCTICVYSNTDTTPVPHTLLYWLFYSHRCNNLLKHEFNISLFYHCLKYYV